MANLSPLIHLQRRPFNSGQLLNGRMTSCHSSKSPSNNPKPRFKNSDLLEKASTAHFPERAPVANAEVIKIETDCFKKQLWTTVLSRKAPRMVPTENEPVDPHKGNTWDYQKSLPAFGRPLVFCQWWQCPCLETSTAPKAFFRTSLPGTDKKIFGYCWFTHETQKNRVRDPFPYRTIGSGNIFHPSDHSTLLMCKWQSTLWNAAMAQGIWGCFFHFHQTNLPQVSSVMIQMSAAPRRDDQKMAGARHDRSPHHTPELAHRNL